MLLILLGYFLLPSPAEGNTAFTCSPGRLKATCDAGKVILIRQVRRGSYVGAFDGSHCKYQVGDGTESEDGNSKDVWEDCNLQSSCDVLFNLRDLPTSRTYYLEMDYACMAKININMFDVCDSGTGTLLEATNGYMYSPCYPNLSTLAPGLTFCTCTGAFEISLPRKITVSVFHAFQENEKLEIRWGKAAPRRINKDSPNFQTFDDSAEKIYVSFSSYQQPDRFWLEFTADEALKFTCSMVNIADTTPTCPIPPTPKTTTTTTTTRTTTTTPTPDESTPTTSTSKGGSPGVTTTIPGTATTSNALSINTTFETEDKPQLSQTDIIAIAVGIIILLIVIAAIVATVLIILRKRRQAAKTKKSKGKEKRALNSSAVELNGSFVNPGCDPEVAGTGASMPGVGAAAARGEETESPYAKLEPVERSEYLDLRHLSFAHQLQSK